jgi:hypothetical protein
MDKNLFPLWYDLIQMIAYLRSAWFYPAFSTLLANRTEGLILVGAGSLQLGLGLLHLPGWICPFKALFGIPCPGCGLTAAIGELLHGKVLDSLHTHAFALVFLVGLLLIAAAALLPETLRKRFAAAMARFESRTGLTAWVLLGLMLYWVIRLAGSV